MQERELPAYVIGPYRIVAIQTENSPAPARYVILSANGDRLRYEYTLIQAREWALRNWRNEDNRKEQFKSSPAQAIEPSAPN